MKVTKDAITFNMHTFKVKSYYKPTFCAVCDHLLVGLFRQVRVPGDVYLELIRLQGSWSNAVLRVHFCSGPRVQRLPNQRTSPLY
jgi:hypothetical protein